MNWGTATVIIDDYRCRPLTYRAYPAAPAPGLAKGEGKGLDAGPFKT